MTDRSDEQWVRGDELTLHTGLTQEELRATALQAAASSWAGISSVRNRNDDILHTAERFYDWLTRKHVPEDGGDD